MVIKPVFQLQAVKWTLVGVILAWAVSATVLVLRNKQVTLLIAEDASGARLITDRNDEFLQKEELKFVRMWLHLYTNYDKATINDSVGRALDWVTQSVYEQVKPELSKTLHELEKTELVQMTDIKKIQSGDPGVYRAEVLATQFHRANQSKRFGTIDLHVRKSEPSRLNPWGLEIVELQEQWHE